jgi:hypothetical protein
MNCQVIAVFKRATYGGNGRATAERGLRSPKKRGATGYKDST